MTQMLFKRFRKYDYIVNISSKILSMFFQYAIDLSLNVNRRIFVIYNCYAERFLIAMIDHSELVPIFRINFSLIKKKDRVDYCDI